MLVDVICLRHLGEKLPAEVVKAGRPTRGHLVVSTWVCTGGVDLPAGKIVEAKLPQDPHNPGSQSLIPPLLMAVLTKIDGDDMIMTGRELIRDREERAVYPQSWWCRIVRE